MKNSLKIHFFSTYLILILISKLLVIAGVLYFIFYVNSHRDFYLGLGLREATTQHYLLIMANTIILLAAFGLLIRKKRNFLKIYVSGKIIELIALIWAAPIYVDAIGTALRGLNESLFSIYLLIAISTQWLIFLLIILSFKNLLHQ